MWYSVCLKLLFHVGSMYPFETEHCRYFVECFEVVFKFGSNGNASDTIVIIRLLRYVNMMPWRNRCATCDVTVINEILHNEHSVLELLMNHCACCVCATVPSNRRSMKISPSTERRAAKKEARCHRLYRSVSVYWFRPEQTRRLAAVFFFLFFLPWKHYGNFTDGGESDAFISPPRRVCVTLVNALELRCSDWRKSLGISSLLAFAGDSCHSM